MFYNTFIVLFLFYFHPVYVCVEYIIFLQRKTFQRPINLLLKVIDFQHFNTTLSNEQIFKLQEIC